MRSSASAISPDTIARTLRRTFGLKRLREGQEPVIARVLRGLSTLAVMPTGAGKSLCYQLPAVLIPGRTVVVSPLIALMKDQCDTLVELGIDAVQTHSAMSAAEAAEALARIETGSARIVFTTPERLGDADFQTLLKQRPVGLLVVDEAHCISQWGHDFRPAFLELGNLRHALGDPTVLALTATAPHDTLADITTLLDIPHAGVITSGVYRPNLHFGAEQVERIEDKLSRVLALVRAGGRSGRDEAQDSEPACGIVYVSTVKAAELVFGALQAADIPVGLYHGKLGAARRRASQDDFMAGRVRVMVATNAFGLGVDKPDIRFVLHYQIPPNLDAYYQEAGRAGRDGETASCTLLFAESDKSVQSFFLGGRYPGQADFQALCRTLARATPPSGGWQEDALLDAASEGGAHPRRKCAVVLSVLRQQGVIAMGEEGNLHLPAGEPSPEALEAAADAYRDRREQDKATLEAMVAYAQSGRCRWRLLLEHFEEAPAFERCSTCDNCRRLAAHEALAAQTPQTLVDDVPVARPAFAAGDRVRTRRHGLGSVVAADSLSVTVGFDNGETRCFQPQFVRLATSRRSASGAAAGEVPGPQPTASVTVVQQPVAAAMT